MRQTVIITYSISAYIEYFEEMPYSENLQDTIDNITNVKILQNI